MKSDLQELALLEGLAVDDREAVRQIYGRHFGMIQTMILRNNGSADDARDIFQEAMIVLYERARSDRFTLRCQLKTYLYSVCRRLWLKKLSQDRKTAPEFLDEEATVPVEDDLGQYERQDRAFRLMERAMLDLGEPCKSLLEAYYVRKQNMREIAEAFGYTNPENAKNQKYKCLMRLRKRFFHELKNGKEDG